MAEPVERNYNVGIKNTFLQFLSMCGEKWQTPLCVTVSRNTGKCDRDLTHICGQHPRGFPRSFLEETRRRVGHGGGNTERDKDNKTPHSESVRSARGDCVRGCPLRARHCCVSCLLHPRAQNPSLAMTSYNKTPFLKEMHVHSVH